MAKIQRGTFDEYGNVTIHEQSVITDSKTGETALGKPHTRTVVPGDDLSTVSGIALEVCEKLHTPERKAKIAELKAGARRG